MAVAKVLHLELIAHITEKEKLLKSLEKASLAQIKTKEEILIPEETKKQLEEKALSLQEKLSKINFLEHLISIFAPSRKSLVDTFLPPKIIVKKEELTKVFERLPLEKLYKEMEAQDVVLRQTKTTLNETLNNIAILKLWKNLDFNPLTELKNATIVLGSLPASKKDAFFKQLETECPLCTLQVVSKESGRYFSTVFVHKDEIENFNQLARQYDFTQITLPPVDNTVAETLSKHEKQVKQLQNEIQQITSKIQTLGKYKTALDISRSFLQTELARTNIEIKLMHTPNIFVTEGWIKKTDAQNLEKIISEITKSYALTSRPAKEKEKPPIILQNPRWLKPFEAVTALYGMPSYREIDPTPYLAPFFLIFFGLAIGDVAYGVVLALLSWLLRRTNRFSENAKTFLTLFIYGGLAAALFGVITGSWLTLEPNKLPVFLQKLILFNPLDQPVFFLVITLILGLVQIYLGLILKLLDLYKGKSLSIALQSQIPPLLLLPGVALLIAQLLGLPLSNLLTNLAIYLSIAGSLGVILFSQAEERKILSRIGGGLYNLYSMSSFLGDTISYGRIMALGLATFLIGSAINTIFIGGVIFKSLLAKILLGILVLPILHLFNLTINTIGAFVHPARLQYVEFFGKFFEGGGRRFKPLKVKTDNIIITSEE